MRLHLQRELGYSCIMDADTHIHTYTQLVHVCVVKAEGKLLNLSKDLSIGANIVMNTLCIDTYYIFSNDIVK